MFGGVKMKKLNIINTVIWFILFISTISLIGQTYYIISALNWHLLLQSPLGYINMFEFWFYGISNPVIPLDPAWPSLVVIILCLFVLNKGNNV